MSGKGALTQFLNTIDCVSVYHITTVVVPYYAVMQRLVNKNHHKNLLSHSGQRADTGQALITCSLSLPVTYSFCCWRHFQVELFEWTAVKRCWGGDARPPQPPAHRLPHMQSRHDSKRRGGIPEDWRKLAHWLTYSERFKTHRAAASHAQPKSCKLIVPDKAGVWQANAKNQWRLAAESRTIQQTTRSRSDHGIWLHN